MPAACGRNGSRPGSRASLVRNWEAASAQPPRGQPAGADRDQVAQAQPAGRGHVVCGGRPHRAASRHGLVVDVALDDPDTSRAELRAMAERVRDATERSEQERACGSRPTWRTPPPGRSNRPHLEVTGQLPAVIAYRLLS